MMNKAGISCEMDRDMMCEFSRLSMEGLTDAVVQKFVRRIFEAYSYETA